jgi:hypothetical protein
MIDALVPKSAAVNGFCRFRALFEALAYYLTYMKLLDIMYT